ncbi:hypothetical protein SAMN05216275_11351 [Streptosporangium canum]|uniref:Uncharacterized protein n=1 Tax=Streptosporangium canum TaxID=324952 RepID=A0A1I3UTX5_9ACTN|nr:hypothetical protein [Streptosporangium canum]SFJ85311.1 hypothetical protein SAMN05216275_11351 [Streptosporangium canum]
MPLTKRLAAVVLTAAVLGICAPATAHAATTAPSIHVATANVSSTQSTTSMAVTVPTTGSTSTVAARGTCSRVKGWKVRLACEAVVRAGGAWVWKKLEKGARAGWKTYSEIFEKDVPRTYRKILKKLKHPIYCSLSRSC